MRRGPAPLITLHQAASERAEAEFVARTIDKLLGGASFHSLDTGRADGVGDAFAELSFGDIAVLYRTGAAGRAARRGADPGRRPALPEAHPERLLDHAGVRAIVDVLRSPSCWAGRGSPAPPCPPAGPDPGSRCRRWSARPRGRRATPHPPTSRSCARRSTPPSSCLPLADRCAGDLDWFLAELALGAQVDALDPRADRVSLLTMHAAKGLEFLVVFVTGCEDGCCRCASGPAARPAARPTAPATAEAAKPAEPRTGAL